MSILAALDDPELLGGIVRKPETFRAWRAFLASLFGLPMSDDEEEIFRECTGRVTAPTVAFAVAWLVIGRRGGKSFVLALIAVFLAASGDYAPYLAPGERGTILITAVDRKQARTIFRYIKGILRRVPTLAEMIERETADSFDLDNDITIEVGTASFRTVRGYTIVCFLGDEAAFWAGDDSAAPDVELIAAVRPAMSTIPNAMMLIASSPYARKGILWEAHRKYFGIDDAPELVWQAPTKVMNPTVPDSLIKSAYEDDPASADAEYGANFRSDVASYVSAEALAAVIDVGIFERMRFHDQRYTAFIDPAGGSGSDAMTLAVSHMYGGLAVLDCIREIRPPFSPQDVVVEFATLLASYGIKQIVGDRWGGKWVRQPFEAHGIAYELAELPKSAIYQSCLPLINSRKCVLLDNARMASQFTGLERRTARNSRDSIDHAPNGHDDIANAVAGALVAAVNYVAPTPSRFVRFDYISR